YTLETTLGRYLFNETTPVDYPYVNFQMGKKQISTLVNDLAENYRKVQVATTLDALKDAGYHWATRCGLTIGIEDVVRPPREYDRGLITDNERRQELTEVWAQATGEVAKNMEDNFPEDNPVWMMVQSGARGNPMQVRQIAGIRGLVSNTKGETIPRPIKSSY